MVYTIVRMYFIFVGLTLQLTCCFVLLGWAITPPMQSHLIRLSPETSDIQQSLNNAALHLGIAFGTYMGGLVITYRSISWNPAVGVVFVVISFITGLLTMRGNVQAHYGKVKV